MKTFYFVYPNTTIFVPDTEKHPSPWLIHLRVNNKNPFIFKGKTLDLIGSVSLLEMLNIYLEAYSRKKGISVRSLTQKKFNKELFAHNLCLFEYVGIRHNVFTFRMKDIRNENVRVIFIKLTTEQYKKLKKAAERNDKIFIPKNYKEEEVKEIYNCLKYFCENVQSLIGEVGAPSKVLEAEN